MQRAYLDNPFRILTSRVAELRTAWKSLDQTGVKHASKDHLRLELLKRAFYKEFAAEHAITAGARQSTDTSKPQVKQLTDTPKSHVKQSLARHVSPTSVVRTSEMAAPLDIQQQLERRLAAVEGALKVYQHKVEKRHTAAEAADTSAKGLCVVLYNVPEGDARSERAVWETTNSFLGQHMTHADLAELKFAFKRLGRNPSKSRKPRPLAMRFDNLHDKDLFLKHAGMFQQAGVHWDHLLGKVYPQ